MRNRNSSYWNLGIPCFLTGAALGAVAGLLAAPHSGRRTRRLIERRAQHTQDRLADLAEDISERGLEVLDVAKRWSKMPVPAKR